MRRESPCFSFHSNFHKILRAVLRRTRIDHAIKAKVAVVGIDGRVSAMARESARGGGSGGNH
jgi:hypothetical protein